MTPSISGIAPRPHFGTHYTLDVNPKDYQKIVHKLAKRPKESGSVHVQLGTVKDNRTFLGLEALPGDTGFRFHIFGDSNAGIYAGAVCDTIADKLVSLRNAGKSLKNQWNGKNPPPLKELEGPFDHLRNLGTLMQVQSGDETFYFETATGERREAPTPLKAAG